MNKTQFILKARFWLVVGLASLLSCDGGETTPEEQPEIVTLSPEEGESGVSIGTRVQAEVPFDLKADCRLAVDNSTLKVFKGEEEIEGTVVYFIDGLRIDFTPQGLFDYGTDYRAELTSDCSKDLSHTFSTIAEADAVSANIAVDDVFRMVELDISEPGAITPILQEFLTTANLLVTVMGKDEDSLNMLGGEGKLAVGSDVSEGLLVYGDNAFLFPLEGTLKMPYFQIVGEMRIQVNDEYIFLDHFEIGGRFVGDTPAAQIVDGTMRALAACDVVCALEDESLQMVCANRTLICDASGNLNLIGRFDGAANDLRTYQEIEVDVSDNATDVPVGQVFTASFNRAVNAQKNGSVLGVLRDGTQTMELDVDVASDGLSATLTPAEELSAGVDYSLAVVALGAVEINFTTAP